MMMIYNVIFVVSDSPTVELLVNKHTYNTVHSSKFVIENDTQNFLKTLMTIAITRVVESGSTGLRAGTVHKCRRPLCTNFLSTEALH